MREDWAVFQTEKGREDIPDRKTKCHGTGTKCHKARTDSSVGSAFEQREK